MTEQRTVGPEWSEIRRVGDDIQIPGGYQHWARTEASLVQRTWHAEKERMIRQWSPPTAGDHALDIGCGSGVLAHVLAGMGASVLAVDANPTAIDYARAAFPDPNIEFRLGLVEDIDAPLGSIDRTYCFEIVEHLYAHQVEALSRRVHALTRGGGTFVVTTPNYKGVWPLLEWTLDALTLVPHLKGYQHVTRFTAARLRTLLEDTGWTVEQLRTFSTFAPWAALFGEHVAARVAAGEDRIAPPWGSILFAVARKRDA